jgi:hypothetical protein
MIEDAATLQRSLDEQIIILRAIGHAERCITPVTQSAALVNSLTARLVSVHLVARADTLAGALARTGGPLARCRFQPRSCRVSRDYGSEPLPAGTGPWRVFPDRHGALSTACPNVSAGTFATRTAVTTCRVDMPACSAASCCDKLVSVATLVFAAGLPAPSFGIGDFTNPGTPRRTPNRSDV